jgi:hypothetical protein
MQSGWNLRERRFRHVVTGPGMGSKELKIAVEPLGLAGTIPGMQRSR